MVASIHRRDFLKGVGLGVASLVLPGCGKQASLLFKGHKKRTNIVVVLCDDLGYGDLGCYGHPYIKTPNLDQFAQEGQKFTDCYAAAPVCSPARAGILTGRTPYRSGIYDWIPENKHMHLRKEETTVATLLKNSGYATCHVGKWHCNGKFNSPEQPQPNDHGFDYWFSTQNNALPNHHNPVNFVRNGKAVGEVKGYSSEIIVDEALHWLKDCWDRKDPFCLFVWFHSPHEPIATGAEFMKSYEGHKEAIYYGNVAQMDHAFGRLMKSLRQMNLVDNSLVMFTSDNGPETLKRYRGAESSYGSPGCLRGMKLHMYEGGIRIPGMIRWPGHVTAGSVSDEPINGTDILPTLCNVAGVTVPKDKPIDGVNILPALRGKKLERKIPLYWRYDRALSKPFTVAMRWGDWKILADNDMTKFELYNLRNDKEEKQNLAGSEIKQLERMKKILIPLHHEIDAEGPVWPDWKKK